MKQDLHHQHPTSDDVINTVPSNQGQQAVSGSESVPEADDDTLQVAQDLGTQLDENEQNPQDIDIGRDINKAVVYHKKGGTMAKYGKKAQEEVEKAMHEYKRGQLTIGKKGGRVKSRKQAIAIGLSQAREKGAKVPKQES